MGHLVLLRHGQSQWNLENRFTGWIDVPLSAKGSEEATAAASSLAGTDWIGPLPPDWSERLTR